MLYMEEGTTYPGEALTSLSCSWRCAVTAVTNRQFLLLILLLIERFRIPKSILLVNFKVRQMILISAPECSFS